MRKDEQFPDLADTFVAHRSQLCQAAARILGSRDRAEDVVQDAYLKVMEAKTVFSVKEPAAYVFRMVRNLAIDHYRRSTLESNVFAVEEAGQGVPSPAGTPEAISIGRQELNLVARALGELPERTRRVFELYRMGGHTQREIAKMLGVSPTLVNFMIRDALNHCRSALESAS
ncbi:RNA polymerase factor sigma-70 [Microbulbifer taiwanensis]|uniref:RNA polymerase factor sigma-70 n=1 Tax=Microbulbifer taiwanensis TaxID=986746 RepID=A0ABW1YL00_9GAMM|nr:RNA polymerase factor sigma-70 [Microbulbifer taiwanensis]